jgi:hypothetical protein
MVQYQFQIIGHDFLQSHFQAGCFIKASNSSNGTTFIYTKQYLIHGDFVQLHVIIF